MSVLNQSGEEQVECPLCLEPLEVDDLNFFPCTCGYQICRFCWHRIRTDENGLCPACRKAYSENPADFKPLSQEEVARLKAEKRHKDQQRKQKITENRKHLANIRVVQRNLVFVVGLPMRLADAEVLKKHEYFGKFGKIQKVVINQSTSYAGSQGPSASAYVTYLKADDALRAIQAVNNIIVDGRTIKTSLGTTKYCSHFMKNQPCPKSDCMYLHELGDVEASFTKEEMQQGKHQEYEKKLHEQLLNTFNQTSVRERKPTPSPPAVASNAVSSSNVYQGNNSNINNCSTIQSSNSASCVQGSQSCSKEAWPSLQPGVTSNTGTVGLPGGTGSTNSNNVPNSGNNNNNNVTKSEGRRQRFEQQGTKVVTNSHKKRHTSGEDNRGKTKEKFQSSSQDEVNSKANQGKANSVQHSRSHKDILSHELIQNVPQSTRSSNNSSSSSPSDIVSGPSNELDSDVQDNDEIIVNTTNACNVLNASGRQSLSAQNSGRILPANHRATLFEPDNNSFFSTNSFTKVTTTNPGTVSTDWHINGLTLTHMPDVLPPVHSSEDWQAAFGFTNSTNIPASQNQDNSCNVIPSSTEQRATNIGTKLDASSIEHVFDATDQQETQNFKNSLENKPSVVESVVPVYPSPVPPNFNEEFRIHNSNNGHMTHISASNSLESEEAGNSVNLGSNSLPALQNSLNPAIPPPNSGAATQQMFSHSSFVHQDPTIMMMQHQQYPVNNLHITGSHMMSNGLPPSQATSKFLAEFHLRQQQNQNMIKHLSPQSMHLCSQPFLESENFANRSGSSLNMNSVSGKFGMANGTDFNTPIGKGGRECNVNSESELQNSGDDIDCLTDEKYLAGFLSHQQKNLDSTIEMEYKTRDRIAENLLNVSMDNEEIPGKEGGRLADDELGFDPFHETQKALAEMMEKENMMQMMQNKQSIAHGLHSQQATLNHLTQHLYHLNQLNQLNHQIPHGTMFSGNKQLNNFYGRNQHILQQQNHRLPINVSSCTKLMDGLGLGPSSGPPIGPQGLTRSRLPPPGFATAPNHMNAFGLGIPRAPSNNGSKILPFMGLGNSPTSSNNGASSPIPQTVPNHSSNLVHPQQDSNQQSVLFPSSASHTSSNSHTFGLQNGVISAGVPKSTGEVFNVKEWPENLQSLLPNLNSSPHGQNMQFPSTNTPPPPPPPAPPLGNLNSVFGTSSMHGNTQKGWSGVGPCTDWTALDPAIVSSSCQHTFLINPSNNHLPPPPPMNPSANPGLHLLHSANSMLQQNKQPTEHHNSNTSSSTPIEMPHLHHQMQQNNTGHWLRGPTSEEVFYDSNILSGSPPDWAASVNHTAGNSQAQQNHMVGSPNSGSVMMAAPPPGFSTMRLAAMQQGNISAKASNPMITAEVGNNEISDVVQSESGILQNKEEERLEGLR